MANSCSQIICEKKGALLVQGWYWLSNSILNLDSTKFPMSGLSTLSVNRPHKLTKYL
jgi:hypothetical protein